MSCILVSVSFDNNHLGNEELPVDISRIYSLKHLNKFEAICGRTFFSLSASFISPLDSAKFEVSLKGDKSL